MNLDTQLELAAYFAELDLNANEVKKATVNAINTGIGLLTVTSNGELKAISLNDAYALLKRHLNK